MPFIIYHLSSVTYSMLVTPFNIRLNNHSKDVKDPKTILADNYFKKKMVIDLTNTQDSR